MSRRSSSKLGKDKGAYKVNETSLGAAFAAKDPQAAQKLVDEAAAANTREARARGGPQVMPGDFTPARKQKATKSKPPAKSSKKPKKKRSKTLPANPKPKNGPLKIRRTVVQAKSPKASAPARPNISEPVPQDLQAAFRTMERSDGLGQYAVPPDQNTVDQLNELGRCFRLYLANQTLQRDAFILTIGFDFGTSCSKIIVNAPYAGERSFALVVPDFFQMDEHPHLWKGILSLEKLSERLSLSPTSGSSQLTDLKTTLMGAPHKVMCKSKGAQLTSEHCCAAFIGLLLRLTKGWIWQNFSRFFGKDPERFKIRWEANFGLPAATIDNSALKAKFSSVFRAAWQISESSADVDGNSLSGFFVKAEAKQAELSSVIDIRPEVAAQAIGLIRANLADVGTYALIDVGASTLDVCVFNYLDAGEWDKQALFVADVTFLGAQSPIWFEQIKRDGLLNVPDIQLRRDIRQAMASPVLVTKTQRYRTAPVWSDVLPVIFTGGGRQSVTHRDAFSDFRDDWIRQTNSKGIKLVEPVIPKGLKAICEQSEYHRLSVAWGLSLTKDLFAEVELPSEIPPDQQLVLDISDNYPSKDHV